jgi:hypothetical protein
MPISIPLRQIRAAGDNANTGLNSRCHPAFLHPDQQDNEEISTVTDTRSDPPKKLPRRGGWFLPLPVLKDVYAGSPLGLASGHFSAQTARRDSSARCRSNAYG